MKTTGRLTSFPGKCEHVYECDIQIKNHEGELIMVCIGCTYCCYCGEKL